MTINPAMLTPINRTTDTRLHAAQSSVGGGAGIHILTANMERIVDSELNA